MTHIDFSEGHFVTIKVPKIDRSSTDQPKLVAKVVQCKGTADKSYRLQCKHGFMDGWYSTSDSMPYEQEYDVPVGKKSDFPERSVENGAPQKSRPQERSLPGPMLKELFLC